MSRLRTKIGLALVAVVLAACSSQTPSLMNLRATGAGPDEFGILPTRPLEIPTDLASLPTPMPGATNRVDPDPEADVAAALGGDVNRARPGTASLIGHATRFGVGDGIREVLAAEDLEFRRRNNARLLERLAATNVYYRAYRMMALDRYAELERMRAAGIRTPAAPPQSIGNIN